MEEGAHEVPFGMDAGQYAAGEYPEERGGEGSLEKVEGAIQAIDAMSKELDGRLADEKKRLREQLARTSLSPEEITREDIVYAGMAGVLERIRELQSKRAGYSLSLLRLQHSKSTIKTVAALSSAHGLVGRINEGVEGLKARASAMEREIERRLSLGEAGMASELILRHRNVLTDLEIFNEDLGRITGEFTCKAGGEAAGTSVALEDELSRRLISLESETDEDRLVSRLASLLANPSP